MKPWGQKRGRVFLSRLNATKFISLHRPFYLYFSLTRTRRLLRVDAFFVTLLKNSPSSKFNVKFLISLLASLFFAKKLVCSSAPLAYFFFDTIATVKRIRRTRRDLRPRTPGVQPEAFSTFLRRLRSSKTRVEGVRRHVVALYNATLFHFFTQQRFLR